MYTELKINNFETCFILGNNPEEKIAKRKVILNIIIRFPDQTLRACSTDDLSNTISYSGLLKYINKKSENANFNLIEKAAKFIYDITLDYIKSSLDTDPEKIMLHVEVIKPNPPVKNLESASFVCSDFWENFRE